MNVELTWASLGVIVSIIIHAYYTVRWASKVEYKLGSIADSFCKLDKELEKRDIQITAAWKQIDSIKDRVVRIEALCSNHHNKEEQ